MEPSNRSAPARISQAWEISASIRVSSSDAIILPGRKILKVFFCKNRNIKPKLEPEKIPKLEIWIHYFIGPSHFRRCNKFLSEWNFFFLSEFEKKNLEMVFVGLGK